MDHLLYGPKVAEKIKTLVTMVDMLSPDERTEILIQRMKKYKTNDDFLEHLGKE